VLSSVFEAMDSLKEVSLSKNASGAEGTTAILKSLFWLSQLQILDLSYNVIASKEAHAALKRSISSAQCLTVLNLENCCLENEGAEAIFEALKDNCPDLTNLDLSGNDIEISEELADMILAGLANKEKL